MRTAPDVELLEVEADDGVRLAADHYRTTVDGPAKGLVLIRTPYGRRHYQGQAGAWLRAGYDVVVQDVRGRYGSAGHWNPYVCEGPDGAATVRSLADRGILTGPLVLAGASYDAHCAVEGARTLETSRPLGRETGPLGASPPLAVVAMVPALGLYETAHAPDGTPRLLDRIGWWHQHGFGNESSPPMPEDRLRNLHRLSQRRGLGWVQQELMEDTEYGAGSAAKWRRLWAALPLHLSSRYGALTSPLLVISGDKDFFTAEALDLAEAWGSEVSGARVNVLWGPWGHGLASDLGAGTRRALKQQGGLMARITDFLDHTVPAHTVPARAAWRWQPSGQPPAWSWSPTTTRTLRRHGEA